MDAATVVWLVPVAAERSKPAERALEEWGRSRGLRLSPPNPTKLRSLDVDASVADDVEEELERARDASSALDADAAERSLARAEGALHLHPELPQAAWLMAEVERGWARRWASVPPTDPERAVSAWSRAQGFDGGREPGVGETGTSSDTPDISFDLSLDGEGEARLDGLPVVPGSVRCRAGEHQLTVTRRGELVWAGWISVVQAGFVRLAPPQVLPCSTDDLARVVRDSPDGSHVRADDVRCDLWIVAAPVGNSGELLVLPCRRAHCRAPIRWNIGARVDHIDEVVHRTSRWPAWATWTLVGVGAAAIAGATLGVDAAVRAGSTSPLFVSGGCVGCR